MDLSMRTKVRDFKEVMVFNKFQEIKCYIIR